MGKAMFYHLTRDPLEVTARNLLARAFQQDMRVIVRVGRADRLDWLDQALWLGDTAGFLPHGLASSPHAADQPIVLTTSTDTPDNASILMLTDGATARPEEAAGLERLWVLFDGNDPEAVSHARDQWKAMVGAGVMAEYWSQESGRWDRKAVSGG